MPVAKTRGNLKVRFIVGIRIRSIGCDDFVVCFAAIENRKQKNKRYLDIDCVFYATRKIQITNYVYSIKLYLCAHEFGGYQCGKTTTFQTAKNRDYTA